MNDCVGQIKVSPIVSNKHWGWNIVVMVYSQALAFRDRPRGVFVSLVNQGSLPQRLLQAAITPFNIKRMISIWSYHRPIRIPLSFLLMIVDPSSLLMPIITRVLLLNFPSRSRLAGKSGESRSNYKFKVTFQFALVHGFIHETFTS